VGAQVGTWSYFIQYAQDYTSLPEKTAGFLLTELLWICGWAVRLKSTDAHFSTCKIDGAFAVTNVILVGLR